MKGQLVKLESDVMKQAKNQKLYMALGVFLLLLGLLAVLDEIGLGDVDAAHRFHSSRTDVGTSCITAFWLRWSALT